MKPGKIVEYALIGTVISALALGALYALVGLAYTAIANHQNKFSGTIQVDGKGVNYRG